MFDIIDDDHLQGDILEYDSSSDTTYKLLQTCAGFNLIEIGLMTMIMMMMIESWYNDADDGDE